MAAAIDQKTTTTIPTKTAGNFTLPFYGLGTWGLGGSFSADCREDEKCIAAIRRAIDAGVRHIDTAEMYGAGHAEELVGAASRGHPREKLIIASKALGHHLSKNDLIAAAEKSIARMQCDYLDLYLIHHPSDVVPIADTMRGMDELTRRGLIRAVGVCNFTVKRLREAQAAATQPIVCNQVHYSLSVREPETTGLLEYCQQNNVILVAWQPIDRGIYNQADCPLIAELCAKYSCTAVQLALSWIISQDNVVAISRTMSANHLEENLAATHIQLTDEDIEALRTSYNKQVARSDVYPLR
jgi:diketogulonate reductase-like aldo/keto reductase